MMKFDSLSLRDLEDRVGWETRQEVLTASALTQARNVKSALSTQNDRVESLNKQRNLFKVERGKKYSQAFACIVMFLIGAPLGAIIKKGGLGVPTIVSIFFFIVYYVFMIMGEKWAKEGVMDGTVAVWLADAFLLPFGFFFLRQARVDARLFDTDYYLILIDKFKTRLRLAK
jgi:lipopolysaccharide export system permease protein